MVSYKNAVIYKIHNHYNDICFIGSTISEKSQGIRHKKDCNNETGKTFNYYMYKCIRENGGWDNWMFEVIEKYPCKYKTQLNDRVMYQCILLNRPSVKMCMKHLQDVPIEI